MAGIPVEQLSRAYRRAGRSRNHEGRHWCDRLVWAGHYGGSYRPVPVTWILSRVGARAGRVLDICPFHASGGHNTFGILQFVSASLYSLGHGGNDAQKTMGIIAVLLYSQRALGDHFYIPLWVILSCQVAMALGTLFGGWRIVHTMGSRITRLHPVQGFCAEAGGAATLFLATFLGIPVSTTHTITGAIVGVGAARKVAAVRWNLASNVVTAWILTMPAAALMGAAFYLVCKVWP